MNFRDWYTDTVDIWRVVPVQDGSLTRHERRELYRNIPCRLYQVEAPEVRMSQPRHQQTKRTGSSVTTKWTSRRVTSSSFTGGRFSARASRTYAPLPPAPTTF